MEEKLKILLCEDDENLGSSVSICRPKALLLNSVPTAMPDSRPS